MTMQAEPTDLAIDLEELHVPSGIPGFPAARHFSVRPWAKEGGFFLVLQCSELEGVHFVVMDPVLFFPWYQPRFPADIYQAVGAAGPDDLQVLVILTLGDTPAAATANLLGPVVVNRFTGTAVQAVLSGSGYKTKTPLLGAEPVTA
jgi:flagellar assembly factor FliW